MTIIPLVCYMASNHGICIYKDEAHMNLNNQMALTIFLVILKLTNVVFMPWWLVLSPLWFPPVLQMIRSNI